MKLKGGFNPKPPLAYALGLNSYIIAGGCYTFTICIKIYSASLSNSFSANV